MGPVRAPSPKPQLGRGWSCIHSVRDLTQPRCPPGALRLDCVTSPGQMTLKVPKARACAEVPGGGTVSLPATRCLGVDSRLLPLVHPFQPLPPEGPPALLPSLTELSASLSTAGPAAPCPGPCSEQDAPSRGAALTPRRRALPRAVLHQGP